MVKLFYNFKTEPFQKDIKAEDIFLSASGRELLQRLEYMKQRRGLMVITGIPGTGKTLHLRTFVNQLNPNHYSYHYLPLSTVNTMDFYRQLSVALGGEGCWKKSDLFTSIQKSIIHYVANNKKIPVIIFDEAHLLKHENFYELQIISNFSMDSIDPALFILTGQPHLRDKLLNLMHQAFNQRITLKFNMTPLSKEETRHYIHHQLKLAGRDRDRDRDRDHDQDIFNQNAIEAIYKNSAGVPRLINALALKCLTLGALEKKELLTEEDVYTASTEL